MKKILRHIDSVERRYLTNSKSVQIYILDGLVGCVIGFLILKGAYEVLQDIRRINQGEIIDFEKYKLGVWKSFHKFRYKMLENWVLFQIFNNNNSKLLLESAFEKEFRQIIIKHSQGEKFVIKYPYDKEEILNKLDDLLERELIQKNDNLISLTDIGNEMIQKVIKQFGHH